jgi:hypothetical protein
LDFEEGDMTLTPREERVRTLLEWYKDALETMQRSGDDAYGGAPGSVCLLMGDLWWHPSFRELDRVLREFRGEQPRLWRSVRERFITNTARTVLACPRCPGIVEIAAKHFDGNGAVTLRHKHDGDQVFFVRKTVPVLSAAIRSDDVDAGIRWISRAMRGDVFVPDQILNREKSAA